MHGLPRCASATSVANRDDQMCVCSIRPIDREHPPYTLAVFILSLCPLAMSSSRSNHGVYVTVLPELYVLYPRSTSRIRLDSQMCSSAEFASSCSLYLCYITWYLHDPDWPYMVPSHLTFQRVVVTSPWGQPMLAVRTQVGHLSPCQLISTPTYIGAPSCALPAELFLLYSGLNSVQVVYLSPITPPAIFSSAIFPSSTLPPFVCPFPAIVLRLHWTPLILENFPTGAFTSDGVHEHCPQQC